MRCYLLHVATFSLKEKHKPVPFWLDGFNRTLEYTWDHVHDRTTVCDVVSIQDVLKRLYLFSQLSLNKTVGIRLL